MLFITCLAVSYTNNVTLSFENKVNSICKSVGKLKNYSNCQFAFQISNLKSMYNVYYLIEDNQYLGYLIVDNNDNIERVYTGDYKPTMNDEIEGLSPIFSKDVDKVDIKDSKLSATSNYPKTPTLNTNLYSSHYDSFSSYQLLSNCPTYYNYSYGPIKNGCAPTTGAMLVSFYDRYVNELNNLIYGLLPLKHEDNKLGVDSLIKTKASYMKTDPEKGTYWENEISGLTNYFAYRGYSKYKAYHTTDFNDYAYVINGAKNVAFLRITAVNGYGITLGGHAVVFGIANVRYSGNYMITHYNWKGEREGDYYVPQKYFVGCIYIGER